jgi:hypothetical protein
MASGIVEVCAKSGYDVVFRARGEDKVAAVQKKIEGSLDKAVQRGKLSEQDKAATLARITGTTRSTTSPTATVIEAVVEDLAVKKALFSPRRRASSPARCLATTTSSLPVIELRQATPARRTSWGCTGSTRDRHAAGRGVPPRHDREGRGRDCARGLRPDRASTPVAPAATGPASSSTRCSSLTSTTREDARGALRVDRRHRPSP